MFLNSEVKLVLKNFDHGFQMEKKENFGYSKKKYGRGEMLEM